MDGKEVIREKILGLGVDVCGFGGVERFADAPSELNSMWTKSLAERIKNGKAHCIHIPFKKEPIFDAINQFSVVNTKYPKGGALGYYSEEAYKSWGIV